MMSVRYDAYFLRHHFSSSSSARLNSTIPILLASLMLLCTAPLQPSTAALEDEVSSSPSSGRDAVHDGDWAVAHQQLVEPRYCESTFDYDIHSDYIATADCPSYGESYITIYHNSDWNVLVESVESDISIDLLEFSPDGSYLVAYGNLDFEIYRTSDWEEVFSGNVQSENGYYYDIYGITWSGDGERILFVTGEDGGKMYEGPDWEEVTGTSSTGLYAVHHPTEDILWYVNNDATGNEYEFENIPFVGYQWVMKRSFTLTQNPGTGPLSVDPDGDHLVMSTEYGVTAYSTSDYSVEFTSSSASGPASFSTDSDSIMFQNDEDYDIYSTSNWQEITSVTGPEHDCYSDGTIKFRFTSGDGELLVLDERCYETYLSGWMPDDDSDGVADVQDICPSTSEDEDADAKGCALSQKDTDLDGVNDRDDVCPRTKTSDSADSSGCSLAQLQDSDEDGVSDSDDICPETPLAEFSNIYGCSSNQRDVDGDGVVDAQDNCPLYDVSACPNILSWAMSSQPMSTVGMMGLTWSPTGERAVTAETGSIVLRDESLSLVREHIFDNESRTVYDYLWMPNGVDVLILWESEYWRDAECGYYLWDSANDMISWDFLVSTDCSSYRYPVVSPDGTHLAASMYSTSSYSGSTVVIDLITHELAFEDEDHYPRQLIFTHDGTSLIGLTSRSLNLWDLNDGYLLQSRSIDDGDDLLLSPDGDSLYVYSDETIRTYSMESFLFKSIISFEEDNGYSSGPLQLSLEFSRSSELLYVMLVNASYSGQWNYNSSMQTYLVDENGSLELAMPPDYINTSTGEPVFFPNQTSFLTYVDDENEYHEEGYYLWLPDSDGDGVQDASDLCPSTNLEEFSNEDGCSWEQLDDDEDGISNGLDLCMGTMYQVLIDTNGCSDAQVDGDSDGVCDQGALSSGPSNCQGIDLCPKTFPGSVADASGCSWEQQDEDEDDVPNGVDVCPDTEDEEDADTDGCGEKQRDSDGDTVNDYWDLCPLTDANSTVDEPGCSDFQVDADLDSVCDLGRPSTGPSNCTGVDTCPQTAENETVNANGCSWDQRDDDGDGVINFRDACPDTVYADISPDGCSSWQRDTDNDGINDATDGCAKTPNGDVANQAGCSEAQVGSAGAASGAGSFSAPKWLLLFVGLIAILGLSGFLMLRRKEPDVLTLASVPDYATRGAMRGDGKEWIEFPAGSGNQFFRDPITGQWTRGK
ncbi:thrombospondin type 3 repeat-containing protein [Candidatus Poseidonia alphae]|nr:thrombospondin type 3 repeat-containing protein [Candidatus Poseidonia alphae]